MAQTPEELSQALESIDSDVGIVIVTSRLAEKGAAILEGYREKNLLPLITVIPDK